MQKAPYHLKILPQVNIAIGYLAPPLCAIKGNQRLEITRINLSKLFSQKLMHRVDIGNWNRHRASYVLRGERENGEHSLVTSIYIATLDVIQPEESGSIVLCIHGACPTLGSFSASKGPTLRHPHEKDPSSSQHKKADSAA